MPVWMSHPKHGRTPAVGAEVEWNLKNGWTVDEPKPAAAPTVAAEPPPVEPAKLTYDEELAVRYEAKFGMAPDRRKKRETIEGELKDEE